MFPDARCCYRRVPVTCTNETVDGLGKCRVGEGNKGDKNTTSGIETVYVYVTRLEIALYNLQRG